MNVSRACAMVHVAMAIGFSFGCGGGSRTGIGNSADAGLSGGDAETSDSWNGGGQSCVPGGSDAPPKLPCTNDAMCTSGRTPYCDTAAGYCVGCLADKNCTGTYSFFHCSANQTCVTAASCVTSSDCSPPHPYCSCATGACMACVTDANCGNAMACDHGECVVSCATNADCTNSYASICDTVVHRCVQCTSDSECHVGTLPYCSPTHHVCYQCLRDADCSDAGLACDTARGFCILPCSSSAASGAVSCVYTCTSDAQCAQQLGMNHCNTTTMRCVECVSDANCTGNHLGPFCDTSTNRCVQCWSNADCTNQSSGPRCDTTTHLCFTVAG